MDSDDDVAPLISTKPFITRVIERFRDSPCLWDPMDPSYRDRYKRDEALDEILKLFLERNPKATRVTVWKRIQSLRGAFRKERNKVKMSKVAHSAGLGHIHVPRLWYYNLMKFLEDHEPYRQTRNPHFIVKRAIADGILKIEPVRPVEEDDTIGMVEEEVEGWEKDDDSIELDSSGISASELSPAPQPPTPTPPRPPTPTPPQPPKQPPPKQPPPQPPQLAQELPTASISSKRPPEHQQPEPVTIKIAKITTEPRQSHESSVVGGSSRRQHDVFGEHVAEKLRSLPPEMVPFCQKLINDAIFYAEMNALSIRSRIMNN